MGRAAYAELGGRLPRPSEYKPAEPKESAVVHLISYWQQFCAPYVRSRLSRDERGASLVEYALLVALIAVVCIAAIAFLGQAASSRFSSVGSSVSGT
jgi:pilus assembly protein Flp/PilA